MMTMSTIKTISSQYEKEPFLGRTLPVLCEQLAKYVIDCTLLDTREFSNIIEKFDHRDVEVKSLVFAAFGTNNYDDFNRFRKSTDFLKRVLYERIIYQKKQDLDVHNFIDTLWTLERPQMDICDDIKNKEKEILNEISIVKAKPSVPVCIYGNIVIENNFPNVSYRINAAEIIPYPKESPCKKIQKKKVLLIYENENMNDLKQNQINAVTGELNKCSIEITDFSTLNPSAHETWEDLIRKVLRENEAIFVFYDNHLDQLFDDVNNRNNNCKYKLIGTLMYREYYNNVFRNRRFYSFLINGCARLNHCWLENVYKTSGEERTLTKTKAFVSLAEPNNNNALNKIKEFLNLSEAQSV